MTPIPLNPPQPTGDPYLTQGYTSQSANSPQVEVSAKKKEEFDPSAADREFLTVAHDRFERSNQVEKDWRINATEELDFIAGEHWTQDMKDERKGRPCLTFDRIGPSCDQVTNNMRQNPPEARIAPVGSMATKDEADLIQGLLRNIDQDSNGETAYITAYDYAVKVGRGWWRNSFDWETDDPDSPDAMLQKIVTKRIRNPFSVYPDPAAEEFDYSDMRYLFATEDLDENEFRDQWGGDEGTVTAGYASNLEGIGDKIRQSWFPKGSIRVAEYWYVEFEDVEVCMVSVPDQKTGRNYSVIRKADVPEELWGKIVGTRKIRQRKVKGALITGFEVLKKWDWKGKWIPFIPVLGKEVFHDNKITLRGMIRPAMDSNLAYDYMASKESEAIGLAPISQWLVAEGQLENQEYQWADANRRAVAFLTYKPQGSADNPIPPPIRINAEPAVQAITQALVHRDADIKAALNTWDPNLGEPAGSQSGRAIGAIQRQADNAHFNYADNLRRSMKHDARVKMDLMPYVYSEERVISIFDPDGTSRQVWINKVMVDKGLQKFFRIGEDYSPARYDVTIGSGPSYASRKAQAGDQLMQLAQSMPGPMQRALDLVVRTLDIPDADKIADRLRPPDIQQDAEGQMPIPPQVQAKLAQQGQMIQALSGELQKISGLLEKQILDIQSKERIAAQNNLTKVFTAEVAAKSEEAQLLAKLDHGAVEHQLNLRADLLHADVPVETTAGNSDGTSPTSTPQNAGGGAPPPGAGPVPLPGAGAPPQVPPAQ